MRFVVSRAVLAALAVGVLALLATQSFAMPVESVVWEVSAGGNGHTYSFVPLDHGVSWSEANAMAQAMTLPDGSVGYLATITSPDERRFIETEVLPQKLWGEHKKAVWIGDDEGDRLIVRGHGPKGEREGHESEFDGWHRIMNTELSPEGWRYSSWRSEHEPGDDHPIEERFLTKWFHHHHGHDGDGNGDGECSDGHSGHQKPWIIGMIVEFDPPDVPEPATALLSALGIALLGLRRRR